MTFALIFPGQGSQSVGMMNGFAENSAVRAAFEEAAEVLGRDMWRLAQEGPEEDQNLTVNTQPLMLTAGVAVFRAWTQAGGRAPSLLAGHSLGEYSAWVASGSLRFRDALPLVRLRAQAMQEAVPVGTGAMAAILGLSDDAVHEACTEAAQGEVVEAVNFNAPQQVVIAGHRAAVERAAAVAKMKGARRALLLPVSAPFHSSLLAPAAERLAQALADIELTAPAVPVVNNVDAAQVATPDEIRSALARQACRPVRWVESVRRIADSNVDCIIECGPGRVLAGLTRRIAPRVESLALTDEAAAAKAREAVAHG
ncbi:MAG: ACP S-malonyltransferase [Betaproteobacteria bacterium]|nr:ACP S-malonyltransferase [Betaproteobacteria bacterium]